MSQEIKNTMNQIIIDGYEIDVIAMRGHKVPFKGTTNILHIATDGTKSSQEIRKMYAEHEGIPLSEDADWHGKRVTNCSEQEKKGEYILEIFEPYTEMENKARKGGLKDPKNRNPNGRPQVMTKAKISWAREQISMGYKQYILAQKLGINNTTLSQYLNGHRVPKD